MNVHVESPPTRTWKWPCARSWEGGGDDNDRDGKNNNADHSASSFEGITPVVGTPTAKATATTTKTTTTASSRRGSQGQTQNFESNIREDTEDYDDLDDSGDKKADNGDDGGDDDAGVTPDQKRKQGGQEDEKSETVRDGSLASKPRRITAAGRTKTSDESTANGVAAVPEKKKVEKVDWSIYQDIPLGRQGAQMLTTFGDGKRPLPETVRVALLGARRMVQVAVQDARHLRRKRKKAYSAARAAIDANRPQKPTLQEEWTPALTYRALSGYDPLAYDPKCGFDVEELRLLYPEEMNAYLRWNDMHEEYEVKSSNEPQLQQPDDDDPAAAEEVEEVNDEKENGGVGEIDDDADANPVPAADAEAQGGRRTRRGKGGVTFDDSTTTTTKAVVTNETPGTAPVEAAAACGHLHERLAQFDLRTDRMAEDWYFQFSEVRKGSFLPRRSGRQSTSEVPAGNDSAPPWEWDQGWG